MPAKDNTISIRHEGVVVSVDNTLNTVSVRTGNTAECGSCPAASMCVKISPDDNILNISTTEASAFVPGDKVIISGSEQMHHKAVMLGTIIPCILLIAAMGGVYAICRNQAISALSGLGCMMLFFIVLYCMRNKVRHEFCFRIRKINSQK